MADNGSGTGWPDGQIHALQAKAEGVRLTGRIEFRGKTFRLGKEVGLASLLDFMGSAKDGLGAADVEGIAAIKDVLRDMFVQRPACGACEACDAELYAQCPQFDPGDWPKFWRLARAVHADGEDLFGVATQAMEQLAARPTRPPSGFSPPGPPPSPRSRERSSPLPADLPEAFRKLPEGDLIDVGSLLR
ncbi:MAG TPA: hypothetical protein VIV12_11800 [Streptosporangiaceae bacterium]